MQLLHVLLEVEVAAEALLTERAGERLARSVRVHMESQIVHLHNNKCKSILRLVLVQVQVLRTGDGNLVEMGLVHLKTSADANGGGIRNTEQYRARSGVQSKTRQDLVEGFITDAALELLLGAVREHVVLHVAALVEAFATHVAPERLVACACSRVQYT